MISENEPPTSETPPSKPPPYGIIEFDNDTNAITTYQYALDYHGKAPQLLTQLALENAQRYDLFFLCDTDIPYDDTWDRSGDQKRQVFQKQIIADLKERRIPYLTLSGSLEARMAVVESVLAQFVPYGNFFGCF